MTLLSTADAAHAAGVQPATIRKWAQRGKLTRYGSKQDARWELRELVRLVTQRETLDNAPSACHAVGTTTGSPSASRCA